MFKLENVCVQIAQYSFNTRGLDKKFSGDITNIIFINQIFFLNSDLRIPTWIKRLNLFVNKL